MISKLKQKGDHHLHDEEKQGEVKSKKPGARQWPGLRGNPRIVRVSPLFGGKDRHSKVCTVKGLRDRRIRLSVPTAIQLYDLQNKLGLSQPSKVIDWLIEVTKFDIDNLPPLQISKDFDPFHHQFLIPHDPNAFQSSIFPHQPRISPFIKDVETHDQASNGKLRFHWDAETERKSVAEKGKWIEFCGKLKTEELQKLHIPLTNHGCFPSLQNYAMEYENCYHFEPSNTASFSSQFGNHGSGFQFPLMDANPDSLPPASVATQLLFCPPPPPPPLYNSTHGDRTATQQSHQTQF